MRVLIIDIEDKEKSDKTALLDCESFYVPRVGEYVILEYTPKQLSYEVTLVAYDIPQKCVWVEVKLLKESADESNPS